ncbi:MAG: metal ABC transporter ATP-binding protein [Elusimicrobia bacterium]|nr:metal ABC transporter ATP-binding protein [Elusimicrobiota bacterium]
MTEHPLLDLAGASIGYDREPVLRQADLAIRRGEFWGILGYNGSGKTTLVKTLLGLLPCLKGRRKGRPLRCGYVPQKEKLDPIYPLTVSAVVAMGAWRGLDPFGLRSTDRLPSLVSRALEEAGALELADAPFSSLSGGQRQRVLVARGLVGEPELLVLDEPLAGIDIATQESLLALFRTFKERGLTALMVSHRVSAEKGLFTHVAWLEAGMIESGPAERMFSEGRVSQVFKAEL